jgi:hypothetical protein
MYQYQELTPSRCDGSGLIEELENGVSESVVHHPIKGLIEPRAGIAERVG